MSVIAYDRKYLAADRQVTNTDLASQLKKIFKLSSTCFVAFCGDIGPGLMMVEWYRNGAKREEFPENQKTNDWARLIVVENGELFIYEQYPVKIPIPDKYIAYGSGRDYAMGAMHHGASAIEAVDAAIAHCTTCGFGVDFYEIA